MQIINAAAPACACENYRMSRHSPGRIVNEESLVRFVFNPVHLTKQNKIKPSFFSHVHNRGCSIQRADKLKLEEALSLVTRFLEVREDRVWIGALNGKCADVRQTTTLSQLHRACAVYDSAERQNPAHAELCQTEFVIDEADEAQLRFELMRIFGNNEIIPPSQILEGAIWNKLSAEHQNRSRQGSAI